MIKKLSYSGNLLDAAPLPVEQIAPAPAPIEMLEKKACLVHAGNFVTSDGSGIKFTKQRLMRVVQVNNAMTMQLAADHGGFDLMPLGAHRPLLDMHDGQSSNDKVVGRLHGLLVYEELDIPGVGKKVPCITALVTFLGRETCQRVLDGRIYNLSIGIDEETDLLGELSTVIVPAAPGARLLSAQTIKRKAQIKMAKKTDRIKKLGEQKQKLAKLVKDSSETQKSLAAAAARVSVTARLSGLMRSGRMSPAEAKKQDIQKLSTLPKETLDILFSALENREPVIQTGQKGTANAVDFTNLAAAAGSKKMKLMKAEMKAQMTGKKLSKAELKALEGDEDESDEQKKMGADTAAIQPEKKDLSAERDATHAGLEGGDDMGKQFAEMQERLDSLQTVLASVVDTVSQLMESGDDEGEEEESELAATDADAAEGDDEEKKKLAAAAEGEGDKKDLSSETSEDSEEDKDGKEGKKKEMSEGAPAADEKEKKEKENK